MVKEGKGRGMNELRKESDSSICDTPFFLYSNLLSTNVLPHVELLGERLRKLLGKRKSEGMRKREGKERMNEIPRGQAEKNEGKKGICQKAHPLVQ